MKYEDDDTIQARVDEAVDDGMHAKLLESAAGCLPFGGVFLPVVKDTYVPDHAWLDLLPPDVSVPEFESQPDRVWPGGWPVLCSATALS